MIGLLDWGIGGFGLLRALRLQQPTVRVVYFSDAGFTPYGKVASALLAARVLEVLGCMRARGATQIVVACNAASTTLPRLGVRASAGRVQTPAGDVRVTGVIVHALEMTLRVRPTRLGVMGGVRTIRSAAYGRPLRAAGIHVRERVAQPLSAHIERGELNTPVLSDELVRILHPLHDVDALLLACTHYEPLAPRIAELLPQARILNPVNAIAEWINEQWDLSTLSARDIVLTTGDPRAMQDAALKAFGIVLRDVEHVNPKKLLG